MSVNWRIETYETLESTQDTLREGLKQNPEEGFVIQAIQQTRGRGRQGRLWFSPPGNLYLSTLLKPEGDLSLVGQLSLVSCLSVCKALEEIYGLDRNFILKWPNDILLHGKKCSGILLQTETGRNGEVEAVILGIGINILSAPVEVGIALEDATGISVPLASIRDAVLQSLAQNYSVWRQEGFAPFRGQWLEKTVPAQTAMSVGHGKSLKSGMFQDIDPKGGLVLKTTDGKNLTVTSGEVLFM